MMNQTIVLSLAAFAIGAAGFFLGSSSTSDVDISDTAKSSSAMPSVRGGSLSHLDNKRRDATRGQVFRSSREVFEGNSRVPRSESLMSFYSKLDVDELEEEVSKLGELGMPDGVLASYLLFAQWTELDPLGAMVKAESLYESGIFAKSVVLGSWTSNDPHNAAEYYTENLRSFQGRGFFMLSSIGGDVEVPSLNSIARGLAKKDPEGALSWALEWKGGRRTLALENVFTELAKNDPDKAAQMALSLDEKSRKEAYAAIASSVGTSNFSEAEAWIAGLPISEQSDVRNRALKSLAIDDPKAAVDQLNGLTDPQQKLDLIREIAKGYARGDSAAGVAFLIETGNQEALEASLTTMFSDNNPMRSWVLDNPKEARDYVLAMPNGQARDTTLKSYLMCHLANRDYTNQLDLSATIENEQERGDAFNMLMSRYVRSDEAGARAYLTKDPELTQEQQDEIINLAIKKAARVR